MSCLSDAVVLGTALRFCYPSKTVGPRHITQETKRQHFGLHQKCKIIYNLMENSGLFSGFLSPFFKCKATNSVEMQICRMSFIRILLRLCIKHTERVKQSRLFPPCLRGSDTSTRRGSCVDFLQHKAQSALRHDRGERDREGNVMACVISIGPHFQQNRAIFTVSAPTDPLRWPSDGRKTDELRYLASGGCFSCAPRQTRFLPSSLFHVSCSPALSTWKQQIQ